jgi:opacity protein-like surface antigen
LLILAFGTVRAQKFYATAGIGGTLGVGYDYNLLNNGKSYGFGSYTIESVPVTLGTGFNVTARFGYSFSKYIGIELGMGQFFSLSKNAEWISEEEGGIDYDYKLKGRMMTIVPSVFITPGLEKLNPYARLGLMVGILPVMYKATVETQATTTNYEIETLEKYSGKIAIGFQASAGAEYNVSDLIAIYAEVSFNGISYTPGKSELTVYDVDGVDQLDLLTVYQKETTYVKSLDYDYESNPDPDKPREELRYSYPFSGIGMNFGVKFKFGK